MVDVPKTISALKGQVGWDNPIDPASAIVDATNQSSLSGRKFTENKFVKIRYIKANQDYAQISDSELNSVLSQIEDDAILTVVDRVFDRSDFIDRQVLFPYANNKIELDTLPGPDGFVGYRIRPTIDKNHTFEINRCILEFDGTGSVELVLFNSAEQAPIRSEVVPITADRLVEVQLNWKLDNTEIFYKGEYYFGYFVNGVAVTPFQREYEFSEIKARITGLNIENAIIPGAVSGTLFDLDDFESSEETWGLNPDISVYEDYTDLIMNNRRMFATAIQMQGQIEAMMIYVASLRSNRDERLSEDMIRKIILELDGATTDTWHKKGLRAALNNEITRIKQEIDKVKEGLFSDNDILSITRS